MIHSPFGVLKYSGKSKMNAITIAKSNLKRAVFVMSLHMTRCVPVQDMGGMSLPALGFISAVL